MARGSDGRGAGGMQAGASAETKTALIIWQCAARSLGGVAVRQAWHGEPKARGTAERHAAHAGRPAVSV